MTVHITETTINGIKISIETGRIARQAHGAAVIRMGDTMVLSTACAGKAPEDGDFFPLTVEYISKTYAAGKIPGGYFKREGKPSETEILSARIVDRPLRPLFPEGFRNEVQIINTVISADEKHNADILAITAASTALCLSQIPFTEPVAGVRVGMVEGELKVFPTIEETEAGGLDMVVAGTEHSIMMVEGGAYELKEKKVIEAIALAHEYIKKLVAIQKELIAKADPIEKMVFEVAPIDPTLQEAVTELAKDKLHEINFLGHKKTRYTQMDQLHEEIKTALAERFPESEKTIDKILSDMEYNDMRSTILQQSVRIGNRQLDAIREINCELDILPRAHGSALFTRGETQSLGVITLGTKTDEQRIDEVQAEYHKSYMLHYNFPPYSVGEVKRVGSVSRREVGHGHLAERSLAPILPNEISFPYTIRIVSEIMESNGSSSMATVCSGSLSLMAAGVPIKSHVAGVAMGLIKEGDNIAILTDILGTEDHLGDMDFKVAGTRDGITAIQMDIKIAGITPAIMTQALEKAYTARTKILDIMESTIPQPRSLLSRYAPCILSIAVNREKIGEVIGPGGRVIREIQEETGAVINIEDDGTTQISASSRSQADAAIKRIQGIIAEPEIGAVYEAKVKSIVEFGAFVEYLPGKEGLVHISELDVRRVTKVEDVVKLGEVVKVKLIGIERGGKVRLSMKALKLENRQ
ncbi:MAG: polyribonucleotide nucleotidyltransferase [Chitinivibrionales bacterium]|nr:polyribonucleotide nucleotidyltransferase [Chitinivibrionales bacterium]